MKRIIIGAAAALIAASCAVPVFAAGTKTVTTIDLAVNTVIAGTSSEQPPEITVKCEGVTVTNTGWTMADDMLAPFKGTFAEGKTYGVTADVQPDGDRRFSETDLKVTVNGKTAVCTVGDGKLTVFAEVKAEKAASDDKTVKTTKPAAAATPDAATPDAATSDSGKNYDNTNNANGAIPTNESNATVIIFAVVIGIAAAGGIAYFIITKRKK